MGYARGKERESPNLWWWRQTSPRALGQRRHGRSWGGWSQARRGASRRGISIHHSPFCPFRSHPGLTDNWYLPMQLEVVCPPHTIFFTIFLSTSAPSNPILPTPVLATAFTTYTPNFQANLFWKSWTFHAIFPAPFHSNSCATQVHFCCHTQVLLTRKGKCPGPCPALILYTPCPPPPSPALADSSPFSNARPSRPSSYCGVLNALTALKKSTSTSMDRDLSSSTDLPASLCKGIICIYVSKET